MTTAYVVQVDLPGGARYLGASGKLQTVPKFFRSAPSVKSYLKSSQFRGWQNHFYVANAHSELTKVIMISDIDKGLKDSKAEILGYGQFLEKNFGRASRGINNPKALYKIRLADKSLVSYGKPQQKFGKAWNRAGDLRSHITTRLEFGNILTKRYKDATVLEIEMHDDGVNIKAINEYPIIDFYIASQPCLRRYNDLTVFAKKAA